MDIEALFKVNYGLYIVSSRKGDRYNGLIANAFSQVNSEPPTFLVIINKQNFTHDFIEESGVYSVSILNEDAPMKFIGQFGFKSGKDINKFEGVHYTLGMYDVPIVKDYSVAYLICKVFKTVDMGTHTIFVGNLSDCDIMENREPMSYLYYRNIKKGKTAKNAPTFIDASKIKKEEKMDKYVCEVCGYVYDPAIGDPDSGIKPGTKFEDIPDDWVCPVCGAGKDQFKKE